ncbi:MAG TPA: peptidoglycan-associated lipoprotein Pal [Vicinamibacterales bacterium]|nr:peptidoglycan-associated lipoprotein Pal [Acidobacteriota bacterium]HOC17383.1 peptidoglycan-associated lipoprotein Pal [Vicinamibacterales bacterium]
MRTRWRMALLVALLVAAALGAGACRKKTPPVARPVMPPPAATTTPARPPAPPEPVGESPVVAEPAMAEDTMASRTLDELNRDSPLRPVFFAYDSAEISPEAQQALNANAEVLKKYQSWVVTIEGHCDERGTAEYNLALGERRAVAARAYLVSLGIPAERLKVISYGKEFPFDPGQTEEAYAKNRRGHFVITSK